MRHERCGISAVPRPEFPLGPRALSVYCVAYISDFAFISKNEAKRLESVVEVTTQARDGKEKVETPMLTPPECEIDGYP